MKYPTRIRSHEQYEWALEVLSLLMDSPLNPDRIFNEFVESLVGLIQEYERKYIREAKK